jgi:hypothetical protein
MKNNKRIQWIVVAIIVIAIVALAAHRITAAPVLHDASQNLQLAINVSHHSVMSLDDKAPYQPSMYREPVPVAVTAIVVRLCDAVFGPTEDRSYFVGSRAHFIKLQNCVWLCLLWLAVFAATYMFTESFLAAAVAATISLHPLLSDTHVNNLTTELPAAALLVLASWSLARAVARGSVALMVIAGVAFGLLALAKAAFLYVVVAMAFCMLMPWVAGPRVTHSRARMLYPALLLAAFALTVAPWMYRNLTTFGTFQIAERGGLAVYTRALMNQMSREEYRGSFYVWAPPSLQPELGPVLGFVPRDLDLGGRLQRLNEIAGSSVENIGSAAEDTGRPEEAISFWRIGRAQREKLETAFAKEGKPHPDVIADHVMQTDGLKMIAHDLSDNAALTAAFVWRGGPLVFLFLLLGICYSVVARRYSLSLFLLPGLLLFAIYALGADFLPRYGVMSEVPAAVACVVMLQAVWRSHFAADRLPRL